MSGNVNRQVVVRVKPSSKKGSFVQAGLDGELLVYTNEPAVDGKANRAVTKLVADYYEVSKSSVEIVRGLTSKTKTLRIG